jgi:hypothetical protein
VSLVFPHSIPSKLTFSPRSFILYDTQKIRKHAQLAQRGVIPADPVRESVSLVLDIINLCSFFFFASLLCTNGGLTYADLQLPRSSGFFFFSREGASKGGEESVACSRRYSPLHKRLNETESSVPHGVLERKKERETSFLSLISLGQMSWLHSVCLRGRKREKRRFFPLVSLRKIEMN